MSGQSFRAFAKDARDFAAAEKRKHRWDQEITGRGNVQQLTNIDGAKSDKNKNPHRRRRADPVAFSGERPLGAAIPKTLSSDGKKPQPKKNDGAGTVVPKAFTERVEKPPDGRFKTKNVQSISPWKVHKGATPLDMNAPPLTVKGQNRFPLGKKQTEEAWHKLMSSTGIRSKNITAIVEKPASGGNGGGPPVGGGGPPRIAPPVAPPPKAPVAPPRAPSPQPGPMAPPQPAVHKDLEGLFDRAKPAPSEETLVKFLSNWPARGKDADKDRIRDAMEGEIQRYGPLAVARASITKQERKQIKNAPKDELERELARLPPKSDGDPQANALRELIEAQLNVLNASAARLRPRPPAGASPKRKLPASPRGRGRGKK